MISIALFFMCFSLFLFMVSIGAFMYDLFKLSVHTFIYAVVCGVIAACVALAFLIWNYPVFITTVGLSIFTIALAEATDDF